MREITVVYDGLDRVDGSARFGFGEFSRHCSSPSPFKPIFQDKPSHSRLSLDQSKSVLHKRTPRKRRSTSKSALLPHFLARTRRLLRLLSKPSSLHPSFSRTTRGHSFRLSAKRCADLIAGVGWAASAADGTLALPQA